MVCALKQLAQTITPVGHILSSPWAEKAELFPPAPTLRWKPNLGWYVCIRRSQLPCAWHQKSNSRILQFWNFKCCQLQNDFKIKEQGLNYFLCNKQELIHYQKGIFKVSLAFMQQFKFKNWRIGGLENLICDVTNRLVERTFGCNFLSKIILLWAWT